VADDDKQILPFLELYIEEAAEKLSAIAKRPLTDTEMATLRKVALEKCKNRPVSIHNTHKNIRINSTLGEVAGWLKARKPYPPVITGHGTLFKPHDEFNSVSGELVTFLMKERKVSKNKMFELMRAGYPESHPEVKALDLRQKILKLLANSYYGAMSEKGFIFYNENMGPAVTYTGQLIIAATMTSFEAFLSNNLWIRNADQLATHISTSLKQANGRSPFEEWGNHPLAEGVTRESLVAHLLSACAPGWDALSCINRYLDKLSDDDMWTLFLRGNPYFFLSFEKAQDLLTVALNGEIREADPGKIEKHHPDGKAALDKLSAGMLDWVAVHWQHFDMPRVVTEMERRSVILVDTDSNFLGLDPWMNWLGENYDLSEATEDEMLTGLNVMVYLLRLVNDHYMALLTKNLQVQENKRSLINFKSEFVIARMILTNGKKNYAALNRFQEGARLEGDKVELKGLSMKKTTVAKSTGLFFEKSLEENILRAEEVDRIKMIRDIVSLEDRIYDSMDQGHLEYAQPAVVGRIASYANMYSMPVVRGMTTWNTIEVNNPIREGDRVSTFRSKINTDATKLTDIMESFPEDSFEYDAIRKLLVLYFDPAAEPELTKNGLNWIALPKDTPTIPEWCKPLIDIDSVISSNVSPIIPILESLGINQLPTSEAYSNIIKF
jgi:hypothetical protein